MPCIPASNLENGASQQIQAAASRPGPVMTVLASLVKSHISSAYFKSTLTGATFQVTSVKVRLIQAILTLRTKLAMQQSKSQSQRQ